MSDKENEFGHLVGKSLEYSAFAHIIRKNCPHTPDKCGFSSIETGVLSSPIVYCNVPIQIKEDGSVSVIDEINNQEASLKSKSVICPDENRIGLKIINPDLNPHFEDKIIDNIEHNLI